jgi:histidinol-phosphate aminotransferase
MSVSRRTFVKSASVGAAAFVAARGHEAWASALFNDGLTAPFQLAETTDIILSSNENPLGPGQHVLDAMQGIVGPDGAGAGRYLFAQQNDTEAAIARAHGIQPENLMVGAGSSEILRVTADVFTAVDRPVISPDPTFGAAGSYATLLGRPALKVPLDVNLRVDLDAMVDACDGAGLVFYCNPNNPTATVHSAANTKTFIERIHRRSPETTILVDEAYHHYVTDPDYESAIALAVQDPRVIVARTFSKAYGMAGLRVGFAVGHPDTIATMSAWRGMDMSTNLPARVGVVASLEQGPGPVNAERDRNAAVRDFTRGFFHDAGFEDTDCEANFILVDIRRPATDFRSACRERGVRIGGGSALLPNHTRISLGTQAEMARAVEVFADVLALQ